MFISPTAKLAFSCRRFFFGKMWEYRILNKECPISKFDDTSHGKYKANIVKLLKSQILFRYSIFDIRYSHSISQLSETSSPIDFLFHLPKSANDILARDSIPFHENQRCSPNNFHPNANEWFLRVFYELL